MDSEWISVEDRVPESIDDVLIAAGAFVGLAWFYNDVWVVYEKRLKDLTATHWMPLPEPPKEPSHG